MSGGFASEADLRRVNFAFNGRLFRLTDLGTVKRGYADPPQPMFRVNGQAAIGLGISMREGGDMLTLGRNVEHAMSRDHRGPADRDRAAPGADQPAGR